MVHTVERKERVPREQIEYLLEGKMKGEYLGSCLESVRWGSETSVMYEMNVVQIVEFIASWESQNTKDYSRLFFPERVEGFYKSLKLPYLEVDSEHCPRDKSHEKRITDLGGRVRCGEIGEKRIFAVSSYNNLVFDPLSQMERVISKKISEEERESTEIIPDPCYALIPEKENILSLETVVKRTGEEVGVLGRGRLVFPFDGYALAGYVKKWSEQSENPPLFEKL